MILSGALNYEIGVDGPYTGQDGRVTEVNYDAARPALKGQSIGYCNLFDETMSGMYAPYLHDSGTAQEYGEGEIDPRGPGWLRNINTQAARRMRQGFDVLEWDNPDAYGAAVAISVLEHCWDQFEMYAVAKNPIIVEGDHVAYVAHHTVLGCIVESGAGSVAGMEALRRAAGKPTLPVWFVCFGASQKRWGDTHAANIRTAGLVNMGVTWSPVGEYTSVQDLMVPIPP
jgi:hypothetical protein